MIPQNRLLALREQKKLTVQELSKAIGNVSAPSINLQERCERAISVELAIKYCTFFNCTLDYFFCQDKKVDAFADYSTAELKNFLALLEREVVSREPV
ncbi:helix-turn-helix transcriptional regulator [Oscillospiraceae bacterium MB08-C2-2]|nr:helix-turn-helix transcriptional regulator [Oscillospiraceae bacterium MB08-C2-2]